VLLAFGVWHGEGLPWGRVGTFLRSVPEACERFLFCPAKSRISADRASHPEGSVSLGNWRGSRLQAVYRDNWIGAEFGNCRASFAGRRSRTGDFDRWAWFAGLGLLLY
jgi:hypothetical protein